MVPALDECPPKAHVLGAQSPARLCGEVGEPSRGGA
jgi:hypothetical protein